jgi:integrase
LTPRTLSKKPQTLPVVLSPAEVLQFLARVPGVIHRIILTVCYAAGLRISEAVRLRIGDVDSQRMVIRVEQGILEDEPRTTRYVDEMFMPFFCGGPRSVASGGG